MWIVTVLMQGEATATNLQFKTAQRAESVFGEVIRQERGEDWNPALMAVVTDDFSRTLAFQRNLLCRVMLWDAERAMAGDRDMQLLGAVSQAMLQSEALDNPKVRELSQKMQRAQAGLTATSPLFVPRMS